MPRSQGRCPPGNPSDRGAPRSARPESVPRLAIPGAESAAHGAVHAVESAAHGAARARMESAAHGAVHAVESAAHGAAHAVKSAAKATVQKLEDVTGGPDLNRDGAVGALGGRADGVAELRERGCSRRPTGVFRVVGVL